MSHEGLVPGAHVCTRTGGRNGDRPGSIKRACTRAKRMHRKAHPKSGTSAHADGLKDPHGCTRAQGRGCAS